MFDALTSHQTQEYCIHPTFRAGLLLYIIISKCHRSSKTALSRITFLPRLNCRQTVTIPTFFTPQGAAHHFGPAKCTHSHIYKATAHPYNSIICCCHYHITSKNSAVNFDPASPKQTLGAKLMCQIIRSASACARAVYMAASVTIDSVVRGYLANSEVRSGQRLGLPTGYLLRVGRRSTSAGSYRSLKTCRELLGLYTRRLFGLYTRWLFGLYSRWLFGAVSPSSLHCFGLAPSVASTCQA